MSEKRQLHLLLSTVLLAVFALTAGCARPEKQRLIVQNPYEEVNWSEVGRYRANLHTHTTSSDGRLDPHEAVDRYHALGYRILAITDHNRVTYPWDSFREIEPDKSNEYENRDPGALGILAVEGNELSSHHHTGSYFSDYKGTDVVEDSLEAIDEKGGLAVFFHPGRYDHPVEWYTDFYRRHDHLVGMEVFNQGDRYPDDRKFWDEILTGMMPERSVWGYSNDDMHQLAHLGRNWNIFLMAELTTQSLQRALRGGHSYFVYAPEGHDGPSPPVIESIVVDPYKATIHIDASNYESINWVSEGKAVHWGNRIRLGDVPNLGSYVRAMLHGESGSVAGTQPFGLRRTVEASLQIRNENDALIYPDDGHVEARLNAENLTDNEVSVDLKALLDGRSVIDRSLSLAGGVTRTIPVAVPVKALNRGKELDITMDLGRDYGSLRMVPAQFPLELERPLEVDFEFPAVDTARITLQNTLGREMDLDLAADVEGRTIMERSVSLPADGSAELTCSMPNLRGRREELVLRADWDRAIEPEPGVFETTVDLRGLGVIPRLADGIEVDGRLEEWGEPALTLQDREDVFSEDRRDQWEGPEDYSARLWWGWDGETLCLAAEVMDDRHVNPRSGGGIWNGSALQMSVAPPGKKGSNVGLALTDEGTVFHCWGSPSEELAGAADYAVRRDEEARRTVYELRLPLEHLSVSAQPGTLFGLNIVLFDDDEGDGFDFWLQMAPGLAGGRDLSLYPRFLLVL
ncbi:MAG: hypothetical protein KGZ25_06955, partial [Planctomycetes bacterium]|nr:hypothetical protein [Planctomycetota bacterium]